MGWRSRTTAGAVVLGALAWWLWPHDPPTTPEELPRVAKLRKTLEANRRKMKAAPKRLPPVAAPVPDLNEAEAEVPDFGTLIVDVVDEQGRTDSSARVAVRNCEASRAEAGMFKARGHCTIEGWRRDGALYARSEPVQIEVVPGQETYASVELRSARTGGLGVQIGWDGSAIVVQRVLPGTPAEAQGLERGDRIVEVDGIPVAELGLRGFVNTMTGPEGTDVHFVLSYEDAEGEIEEELAITRTFLES